MRNRKSDFTRIAVLAIALVCLSFTSALAQLTAISGNAGIVGSPGTTLTYFDKTLKTIVADSTTGNYQVIVSYDWSGALTPSKAGYVFAPTHLDFVTVEACLIGQDFAIDSVTISGNAGVAGTVLTYTIPAPSLSSGTAGSILTPPVDTIAVTADASGSYSFFVPYDWTGTLTPSKTGYTFIPYTLDFANVLMTTDTNDSRHRSY
jgi:hypothetical protein